MRSVAWLLFAGVMGTSVLAQAQTPQKSESPNEQALHALGDAFVKAFNQHDPATLGALWKEDGVYASPGLPEPIKGRAALESEYAKLFKEDPKCQISSRAQAVAEVEAIGMTLSGILDEKHTDETVTSSYFTAHCELVDGKWKIASVQESLLPIVQQPSAHLQQLDWFIGKWEDKQDKEEIRTTITQAPGGNFLTRRYQRYVDGNPVQGGMQMIGWDQEQQCLRTWLFDEDGSFGEGYFTQEGDAQWSVKLAIKFPDGRRSSLTQIIRLISADKLEIQNVDQEINGSPLPNSPVATLSRTPATQPASN